MIRIDEGAPWTSLSAASPWGAERVTWPPCWSVGVGPDGIKDRPFAGTDLEAVGVSVKRPVS